MSADGTITINNDTIEVVNTVKGKSGTKLYKIINKSQTDTGSNYQCTSEGNNGGYDKTQISIAPTIHTAIILGINSFSGQQYKMVLTLQ